MVDNAEAVDEDGEFTGIAEMVVDVLLRQDRKQPVKV